MSFGFSISDIVTLSEKAYQLYGILATGRKNAPSSFAELSDAVFGLRCSLQHLSHHVENTPTLNKTSGKKDQETLIMYKNLDTMLNNCAGTLLGLEKILDKYSDTVPDPPATNLYLPRKIRRRDTMRNSIKVNWARVMWGLEEKSLGDLRNKLLGHSSSISLLVQMLLWYVITLRPCQPRPCICLLTTHRLRGSVEDLQHGVRSIIAGTNDLSKMLRSNNEKVALLPGMHQMLLTIRDSHKPPPALESTNPVTPGPLHGGTGTKAPSCSIGATRLFGDTGETAAFPKPTPSLAPSAASPTVVAYYMKIPHPRPPLLPREPSPPQPDSADTPTPPAPGKVSILSKKTLQQRIAELNHRRGAASSISFTQLHPPVPPPGPTVPPGPVAISSASTAPPQNAGANLGSPEVWLMIFDSTLTSWSSSAARSPSSLPANENLSRSDLQRHILDELAALIHHVAALPHPALRNDYRRRLDAGGALARLFDKAKALLPGSVLLEKFLETWQDDRDDDLASVTAAAAAGTQ